MTLLERDRYLEQLLYHFRNTEAGSGYSVFITGEAGIGKTSLVNAFTARLGDDAHVYLGSCDSLFTPRPLGPLLDIASQLDPDMADKLTAGQDRTVIFTKLVHRLSEATKPVVMIFEDVHWADEATIDLVKFLARRVYRYRILFLVTYRNEAVMTNHPVKRLFGEIPAAHFSKMPVERFSFDTVALLARARGHHSAEELYNLTGGNPFYVTEILASEENRIPERVKDSILSMYYSLPETTRALWEIVSVFPSGLDIALAQRVDGDFPSGIELFLAAGIIVQRQRHYFFKHELYRIAVEESITPARKKSLHGRILDILKPSLDHRNLSQMVHHAVGAEEWEQVAALAPDAAREASNVGSHAEACRLYAIALKHTRHTGAELADLYERHAYECYLTYQLDDAIRSQESALGIWQRVSNVLREGDNLRFMSRLWWFAGNYAKAAEMAKHAIDVMEKESASRELALAYSNVSQLYMLREDNKNAEEWGSKAIRLALHLNDAEIHAHALNNVGTTLLKSPDREEEGDALLKESLRIATEHDLQEHIARAYVNQIFSWTVMRRFAKAADAFDTGYKYCDERDLDFLKYYMKSCRAQMLLDMGKWGECEQIARGLLRHQSYLLVKVGVLCTMAKLEMRRGNFSPAKKMLDDAREIALPTREAQRIIPVITAALELCWLTGERLPIDEVRNVEATLFFDKEHSWFYRELAYWMFRCGLKEQCTVTHIGAFQLERESRWRDAAEAWKAIGCPYEQALALAQGTESDRREAILTLDGLGATATRSRVVKALKSQGVGKIPRGARKSTRENPASLTGRQMEILTLLQYGSPNKEIADKLFISPKTVDHHITAILSKLEVNTRTRAVEEAQKLGILK
jgi:DNA-binding CsgD family transcriptional regulator/tetratricopeptide (TPR) repeat protein